MGLFKKKPDPISERAASLNDQIASLEAQIKKLSETEAQAAATSFTPPAAKPPVTKSLAAAPAAHPSSQPRLRSTARPRGLSVPAAAATREPIFEEVDQERIQQAPEDAAPAPAPELGTRKFDLATLWQRVRNNFRGPETSNPKLVSYLAAGSIQGLRPLRYEKRVARNRFIVLVAVLALVLWGIIAIFMRSR